MTDENDRKDERRRQAAERAIAEASERRAKAEQDRGGGREPEIDGRAGLEPVRYGDWEVKGLATDF